MLLSSQPVSKQTQYCNYELIARLCASAYFTCDIGFWSTKFVQKVFQHLKQISNSRLQYCYVITLSKTQFSLYPRLHQTFDCYTTHHCINAEIRVLVSVSSLTKWKITVRTCLEHSDEASLIARSKNAILLCFLASA